MENLITKVFKPTLNIKFLNTDCDYNFIIKKIKETNYFNIKQKNQTNYTFGNDLISTLYKDEIYTFKNLTIYIVCDKSKSDFYIPYSYFDSEEYLIQLEKIYKLCLPKKEESFLSKGSSLFKSFILDTYMDDKSKADSFFLVGKYEDAYKIYSKYTDYNDFSHYCIEMAFYCTLKYKEVPFHFIDTFYFNRLIYLLFQSQEYDFLCYRFYKISSSIDTKIMHEIGLRMFQTSLYKRKGFELLYFYNNRNKLDLTTVYNEIINAGNKKKIDDKVFCQNLPLSSKSSEFNVSSLFIMNFTNFFIIFQYQVFNIKFNIKAKGEFTIKNKKRKFEDVIDFTVWFKRPGFYTRNLCIQLEKSYNLKLFFVVLEKFCAKIFCDYRLKSQTFLSLQFKVSELFKICSKHKFTVTETDIIKIYRENILGLTDSLCDNITSFDIINDPIHTDLNFKHFLTWDKKLLSCENNVTLRFNRYKKHKIKFLEQEQVYMIYIKKRKKLRQKVFIYIFNTYILEENTKLSLLINNVYNEKLFLEVKGLTCEVLDSNFVIVSKKSTLFEMRCKNLSVNAKFEFFIRNKDGEFMDFDYKIDFL